MKKAVFFDADGTICDIKKGIPSSTIQALHRLTQNGHLAYLCTGRSRAMIPDDLANAGFNGIVAACGTYIEENGKIVFNQTISPEDARRSVEILRDAGLVPIMEGPDYLYFDQEEYNDSVDWLAPVILKLLGSRWKPLRGNMDSLNANKITAKITKNSRVETACKNLSELYQPIFHEGDFAASTIEFVPGNFSKATGIRKVCDFTHIPWENTVCFGDSNNDLPMFEYAHTKVAMSGSSSRILALADYVTEDLFHDGIWKGLEHLHLI